MTKLYENLAKVIAAINARPKVSICSRYYVKETKAEYNKETLTSAN